MHDVFDSTESFLFDSGLRFANNIHINTHPDIVFRELLFLRDSVITRRRLEESANNLRALGIFQRIHIDVKPVRNNSADIAVEVKDQFSSTLDIGIFREGGENKGAVSFRDVNFLGRAYLLNFGMSNREARSRKDFQFRNTRFLNTRFEQKFKYVDYNGSRNLIVAFTRKFYSLETSWDMGIEYTGYTGKQNLYDNGSVMFSSDHNRREFSAKIGKYAGDDLRMRYGIQFRQKDEYWTGQFNPVNRTRWNSRELSVWFGGISRNIDVKYNIDQAEIEEDVHTGVLFNCGAGIDIPAFAATHSYQAYYTHFIYSRSFSPNNNMFFEIMHDRVQDGRTDIERLTESRFIYFNTRLPHQTIIAHLAYSGLDTPRPFELLYLGEDEGLRGYKIQSFVGRHRLRLNIENRFLTNIHWYIFRIGGALFFDAGTAYYKGTDIRNSTWHKSVGFGLRISIPKLPKAILRIDCAFNLDERKFTTISFSSGHLFKVIYPLIIGLPNFERKTAF